MTSLIDNFINQHQKGFVLLSGGVDSTTVLYLARTRHPNIEAVSIDYGQRHKKEVQYALKTCEKLYIPHTWLNLGSLLSGPNIMLTDPSVEVPSISYADIKGVSPTFVPFRNGTMLCALAAHAQKYTQDRITLLTKLLIIDAYDVHDHNEDEDEELPYEIEIDPDYYTWDDAKKEALDACRDLAHIYFGAHAEDAAGYAYPDCTPEFFGSMANAIHAGTYYTIRLHAPFINHTKDEIVSKGDFLGVDYSLTWSCYKGEELHCGVCPTCLARKDAFARAEVTDPTPYKE